MLQLLNNYRRLFFISIIMIAMGINLNTTWKGEFGTLGTVLIAVGGLFFIMAMGKKKEESKDSTE